MTVVANETIGERLKDLRERRVLTLEELAAKSGVHYTSIARIETGRAARPHPSTIRKLAAALGVSAEYLARGEE
jgi:transcriptional regulator with XRE-family HTH domain